MTMKNNGPITVSLPPALSGVIVLLNLVLIISSGGGALL